MLFGGVLFVTMNSMCVCACRCRRELDRHPGPYTAIEVMDTSLRAIKLMAWMAVVICALCVAFGLEAFYRLANLPLSIAQLVSYAVIAVLFAVPYTLLLRRWNSFWTSYRHYVGESKKIETQLHTLS